MVTTFAQSCNALFALNSSLSHLCQARAMPECQSADIPILFPPMPSDVSLHTFVCTLNDDRSKPNHSEAPHCSIRYHPQHTIPTVRNGRVLQDSAVYREREPAGIITTSLTDAQVLYEGTEYYSDLGKESDLREPYRVPYEVVEGLFKKSAPDRPPAPLLVFINSRSGGHAGPDLTRAFHRSLGYTQARPPPQPFSRSSPSSHTHSGVCIPAPPHACVSCIIPSTSPGTPALGAALTMAARPCSRPCDCAGPCFVGGAGHHM